MGGQGDGTAAHYCSRPCHSCRCTPSHTCRRTHCQATASLETSVAAPLLEVEAPAVGDPGQLGVRRGGAAVQRAAPHLQSDRLQDSRVEHGPHHDVVPGVGQCPRQLDAGGPGEQPRPPLPPRQAAGLHIRSIVVRIHATTGLGTMWPNEPTCIWQTLTTIKEII